jgi:hypothetical protein
MRFGWLRSSETVASQVPKAATSGSDPSAFAVKLTIEGADDLRLLAAPRGGRASPYVHHPVTLRRGGADGGPPTARAQQHVFPSSTCMRPLGVFGMHPQHAEFPVLFPLLENDAAAQQRPRGRAAYRSLYQALPLQLAGRTFAALRLKLLPGVLKYRDPDGQTSEVRTAPAAAAKEGRAPPARAVKFADDNAVSLPLALRRRVPPTPPTSPQPQADSGPPAAPPESTPPVQEHVNVQAVHRAVIVLVEALLAPLHPQARQAMITQVSRAWRLAPSESSAQRGADSQVAPTADPEINLRIAIERVARRCAGVYLAGRREMRSVE